MTSRSIEAQTVHDREVTRLAAQYSQDGYSVLADTTPYRQREQRPGLVFGKRPDIIARKAIQVDHRTVTERVIVEVETEDTRGTKHAVEQAEAFRRAAQEWAWTKFRPIVV